MSDHDSFAAKMRFKRTGKCPVCDTAPADQSGRFTIQHLPQGTEMHAVAVFNQKNVNTWDMNAFDPIMGKVVHVRLQRLEAADRDAGLGMAFNVGAVIDGRGEPVVLVSSPSIHVRANTLAAEVQRANHYANEMQLLNQQLFGKLQEAESAIALLRSPRREDRKRGKRLAKNILKRSTK